MHAHTVCDAFVTDVTEFPDARPGRPHDLQSRELFVYLCFIAEQRRRGRGGADQLSGLAVEFGI